MDEIDKGTTKKRSISVERDEQEDSCKQKLKTEHNSKPMKISLQNEKPSSIKPIQINLKSQNRIATASNSLKTPSKSVAAVFNDEDEEPEEMPREARMRMRNFGRDTPTSAGPNSFGKTKQGFCDVKKVFEKQLREAAEKHAEE